MQEQAEIINGVNQTDGQPEAEGEDTTAANQDTNNEDEEDEEEEEVVQEEQTPPIYIPTPLAPAYIPTPIGKYRHLESP